MDASTLRGQRQARIENEAHKAVLFASLHGEWPLGLSLEARAVLAHLPQSDDLQRRWGELNADPSLFPFRL